MSTDQITTRNSPAIDVALSVCGGITAATASLSAITGLMDTHPAIPIALACVAAIVGGVQVGITGYVQRRTVPADDVLEARVGDVVVAGPANDRVDAGEVVRELGGYVPEHAETDGGI